MPRAGERNIEAIQRKWRKVSLAKRFYCNNDVEPFTLNRIADMSRDDVFKCAEDGVVHCFDKTSMHQYAKTSIADGRKPTNPLTRTELSAQTLARLGVEYPAPRSTQVHTNVPSYAATTAVSAPLRALSHTIVPEWAPEPLLQWTQVPEVSEVPEVSRAISVELPRSSRPVGSQNRAPGVCSGPTEFEQSVAAILAASANNTAFPMMLLATEGRPSAPVTSQVHTAHHQLPKSYETMETTYNVPPKATSPFVETFAPPPAAPHSIQYVSEEDAGANVGATENRDSSERNSTHDRTQGNRATTMDGWQIALLGLAAITGVVVVSSLTVR
jgi:hypothetical protein